MAFAENLRCLRKRRGLTQKQLADLSGVSCNSIINYENSRRTSPPISVLQKLAQALGTSVDNLTSGRSPEPEEAFDVQTYLDERTIYGSAEAVEALVALMRFLNPDGIKEAVKRVRELTEIQRYKAIAPTTEHDDQEAV